MVQLFGTVVIKMWIWSQAAGEEGTSPDRDASFRQKKRVTFFPRNNNIVKKTSNESRQTSLIEENVKNVTSKENAKSVTTNGKNGDEQNVTQKSDDSESDDDASSQSGDDKIRKISDEPQPTTTPMSKTSTVIARLGEKRSKACAIL